MSRTKKVLLFAGAALALLLAGFAGGRFSAPKDVEYRDKIVRLEVQKETQVVNQRVDLQELRKLIADVQTKKNVRTTREVVKAPDGTITERETVTDKTERTSHTNSSSSSSASSATEVKLWKETTKVEERVVEKVVHAAKPDYRLGLNAGYDLARLWGRGAGFNPIPVSGLVGQLEFERRLFGPVFAAAWVQSTGVAGLGLHLEW